MVNFGLYDGLSAFDSFLTCLLCQIFIKIWWHMFTASLFFGFATLQSIVEVVLSPLCPICLLCSPTIRNSVLLSQLFVGFRLQGVDAPELTTRAGKDARRWMVNFLRGKPVECQLNGERSYDRWIGVCYVEGEDIGAAVISAGHALDCRRYSGGRYRHLEKPSAKSRISRAQYCR